MSMSMCMCELQALTLFYATWPCVKVLVNLSMSVIWAGRFVMGQALHRTKR